MEGEKHFLFVYYVLFKKTKKMHTANKMHDHHCPEH